MKQQQVGTALVICAPSGTGKTTLTGRLIAAHDSFSFSVSFTTRAPRPGECDGKDYHFVSREEFFSLRERHFFAEWAEVHGNYYGTPLEKTLDLLAQGRDVLFDIDVQGAAQLKESLPQAFFIFILPPEKVALEQRLLGRGTESPESFARRMQNAKLELEQARWFDAWIINDDVERAYADLELAFRAASLCPRRKADLLENLLKEWQ